MFVVEFLLGLFLGIYESSFVNVLFISTSNFNYNFGIINHKRFIISISASMLDFIFV